MEYMPAELKTEPLDLRWGPGHSSHHLGWLPLALLVVHLSEALQCMTTLTGHHTLLSKGPFCKRYLVQAGIFAKHL